MAAARRGQSMYLQNADGSALLLPCNQQPALAFHPHKHSTCLSKVSDSGKYQVRSSVQKEKKPMFIKNPATCKSRHDGLKTDASTVLERTQHASLR